MSGLVVPSLQYAFALSGGAKAEELKGKSDFLRQRLHVIGKLHLAQLEKAQLTVDDWTLLKPP